MNLIFNARSLSRSITQKQWKEIWRWKRLTEKRLKKSVEEQIGLLVAYGTTMPEGVRTDMIDMIVNSPLLMYPYVDHAHTVDLRPGHITYIK